MLSAQFTTRYFKMSNTITNRADSLLYCEVPRNLLVLITTKAHNWYRAYPIPRLSHLTDGPFLLYLFPVSERSLSRDISFFLSQLFLLNSKIRMAQSNLLLYRTEYSINLYGNMIHVAPCCISRLTIIRVNSSTVF